MLKDLKFMQANNLSITQSAHAKWAIKLSKILTQGTISNILSKRQQHVSMASNDLTAKRQRTVAHPKLDATLVNWVLQCQARQVALSAELVKEKDCQFASTNNMKAWPQMISRLNVKEQWHTQT
ncbi:HTH CenpB-type DNA-binding domain [Forsythia ovata]|uniref:HTH CenpB-type DNA-binding domain n=1 Tax=Forsythia ovata TaxID=205694 RepID=A0ABD1WRK6_9LAMI